TLNLILLTAPELSELRAILKGSFAPDAPADTRQTFKRLFSSWCHNPVATFSLCLLSQAYQASALLIDQFAAVEVTVSFLMQIDKLVQLLESPVFVLLRLQLLDSAAPFQPALLKSLYGLLMLLPQSTAYHTLSSRLSTVSTHNHTLYASSAAAGRLPFSSSSSSSSSSSKTQAKKEAEEISSLLRTFESVQARHTQARRRELQKKSLLVTPREGEGGGGGGGGGAGRAE
ncbi:vac14 family protein, partial [Nannochloropsis oceanica]